MSVGDRIKRRREECGLSVIELAELLGKARSTIYRYESDEIQDMPITVLEPLAEALETTPAFLMGWTDDPTDYDNDDLSDVGTELVEHFDGDAKKIRAFQKAEEEDHMRESQALVASRQSFILWARPLVDAYSVAPVPTQQNVCKLLDINHVVPDSIMPVRIREMIVYAYPAAAGLPLYAESDYERIEVPEDNVPLGADFGIRISGDSMEPTIGNGSIVWVHKQVDIRDGQVGIFMVGDSAVCKRARLDGRGRIRQLESDNPAYQPIAGDDLEGLRIVGKVLP